MTSRACAPFATEPAFQITWYGGATAVPTRAPSTRNSTRAIPPASTTSAASAVGPGGSVAPGAGLTMATAGGTTSPTVTETGVLVPVLPAPSWAVAVRT